MGGIANAELAATPLATCSAPAFSFVWPSSVALTTSVAAVAAELAAAFAEPEAAVAELPAFVAEVIYVPVNGD